MAKIKFPEIRYICQDPDGMVNIGFNGNIPRIVEFEGCGPEWLVHRGYYDQIIGEPNPNWQNTLIDLETDDYDYSDGILTRIEK